MRLLLAVFVAALAVTGAASADTFTVVPDTPFTLPGADLPNTQWQEGGGAAAFPLDLSAAPVASQQLTFDQLLPLWQAAGQQYAIPWSVLAAINKVESNFGQNMGPSSAGAVGWMQFMPDTWARWGTDADGDGVADPWNASDAIYSAARYLAATGGATDIGVAVFAYNHAQWYVDQVLQLADVYDGGGAELAQTLEQLQANLAKAKKDVLAANGAVLAAEQAAQDITRQADLLLARAQSEDLLSDRLLAQKDAVLFDQQVVAANAEVDARQAELVTAQAGLDAARQAMQGASFSPGTSQLAGGPSYSNGYVFPVGGGPSVVQVGRTHHDYPAADIAAPEGSPAYALSAGVVEDAFTDPASRCGIGFTVATTDGLRWTYCHLAYLEPTVTTGALLSAGQPVGLVGQTGHAEGPHLHLQLSPATGYPQDEAWFQSFAGVAFAWSDSVQENAASNPVFALVADVGTPVPVADGIVRFTSDGA